MWRITCRCQSCGTYMPYDSDLRQVGTEYTYCARCNRPRMFEVVSCVDLSDAPPINPDAVELGCGPKDVA